jgi:hypothetical protein
MKLSMVMKQSPRLWLYIMVFLAGLGIVLYVNDGVFQSSQSLPNPYSSANIYYVGVEGFGTIDGSLNVMHPHDSSYNYYGTDKDKSEPPSWTKHLTQPQTDLQRLLDQDIVTRVSAEKKRLDNQQIFPPPFTLDNQTDATGDGVWPFDPYGITNGKYTDIDKLHDSTAKGPLSDNAMDTNWSPEYEEQQIASGKYDGSNVYKMAYPKFPTKP